MNKTWSEGDTLRFIRSHFHFLCLYDDKVFDGLDGRVLLGLNDSNISNILPELSLKHTSMFITKLSTFMTTQTSTSSQHLSKDRNDSQLPVIRSAEDLEPRVLIEVWRDGIFCGEAWLPSILTLNFKDAQDIQLQLRRTWSPEEIISNGHIPRKQIIFGVLRVRARFSPNIVVGSSIQEVGGGSLFLSIIDCSQFSCAIAGKFNFKVFVLPPVQVSETIRLVFESDTVLAEGGENVIWEQQLTLEFLPLHEWKTKAADLLQLKPQESIKLFDLRKWAINREWFRFSPRYNRYDADIFPIHEPCALTGKVFTLSAPESVAELLSDPCFTTQLEESVDLVLLSWGVDSKGYPVFKIDEGQKWTGHSWRLRHLLLCCILFSHKPGISSLIRFANSIKSTRRLNFDEDGSGEASFTLGASKGFAWFDETSRTVPRAWKDQGFPPPRCTISQLIEIGKVRLN